MRFLDCFTAQELQLLTAHDGIFPRESMNDDGSIISETAQDTNVQRSGLWRWS